ncbi:MAG TPA: hypothetical protein VE890_13380 [Thermoguttaceae bacterium]|nr:hypothetical protein [Thermoguttaceae bacterium]
MFWWSLVGIGVIGVGAALALLMSTCRPIRTGTRKVQLAQARHDFHLQRERLEAKFIRLASSKGGPNSPFWDDCEFDDDVAYAKNRNTGELSAFVALTVSVNGHEDSVSGGHSRIGNFRAGTAVFRFEDDHWETDGRAILNLSPTEAIRFYQNDLEMLDRERARQPFAGR